MSDPRIGLCADCRHSQRVTSGRGSVFFLCKLSQSDENYRRYPPLPVLRCPGFDPRATSED